jgi:hypothetical protein
MTGDQDCELTRARVVWSDAENDRLVEGVRRGRSVEELAAELGRSVRAVTRQVEGMLPRRAQARGAEALAWLRERLLSEPNHEWRP